MSRLKAVTVGGYLTNSNLLPSSAGCLYLQSNSVGFIMKWRIYSRVVVVTLR